IELNIDSSIKWLQNGAQPSDTAKRILSYKGVLLKHHLLGGLRKGALTEEQVDEKFNAWLEEKGKIVGSKVEGLAKADADAKAKALQAEKEVNEKRTAAAAEAEAPAEEEVVVEEVAPEVEAAVEEATVTEEAAPEVAAEEAAAPAEATEDTKEKE